MSYAATSSQKPVSKQEALCGAEPGGPVVACFPLPNGVLSEWVCIYLSRWGIVLKLVGFWPIIVSHRGCWRRRLNNPCTLTPWPFTPSTWMRRKATFYFGFETYCWLKVLQNGVKPLFSATESATLRWLHLIYFKLVKRYKIIIIIFSKKNVSVNSKNTCFKRSLSLLFTCIIIFSLFPQSAFDLKYVDFS